MSRQICGIQRIVECFWLNTVARPTTLYILCKIMCTYKEENNSKSIFVSVVVRFTNLFSIYILLHSTVMISWLENEADRAVGNHLRTLFTLLFGNRRLTSKYGIFYGIFYVEVRRSWRSILLLLFQNSQNLYSIDDSTLQR